MIEVKQVEEEEVETGRAWTSCCFKLDGRCIAYVGQYLFSICVLGICTVMLIKADGS